MFFFAIGKQTGGLYGFLEDKYSVTEPSNICAIHIRSTFKNLIDIFPFNFLMPTHTSPIIAHHYLQSVLGETLSATLLL